MQDIFGCTILLSTSTLLIFDFSSIATLNLNFLYVGAVAIFRSTKVEEFFVCFWYVCVSDGVSAYFISCCCCVSCVTVCVNRHLYTLKRILSTRKHFYDKLAVFWVVAPCFLVTFTSVSEMLSAFTIALMEEATSTSETSVNFYQTARRSNPQECRLHTSRHQNPKSLKIFIIYSKMLTKHLLNFCNF
jgi:hypothetical protein